MGYQQRGGSPRNSGRGRGIPRHEKAKVKKEKRHNRSMFVSKESQASTAEEIVNRTLNALNHLGNQRFVVSPFSEQLDLWLTNLKSTLSEFESNAGIAVDDQFAVERSQIISEIELELEKRRYREAHSEETAKNLSNSKTLLEQIEQDFATAMRNIEEQKEAEIKPLSASTEDIREELERIARMKTGILRGISKDAKAQKDVEARQRLEAAQNELAAAVQRFNTEQEKLRTEYEARKQAILKQIQEDEKEIQSQEIDDSLEARRATCKALVNAANSLLQREGLSQH